MAVIIDGSETRETLSWADEFIKGLLAEEEKYQAVIKDLSTDAIAATVRRLDYASEEYLTGTEILQNRATNSTSHTLVVINEEVNENALKVSTETNKANQQAGEEADERYFNIERELARIRLEIEADADKREEQIRQFDNDIWTEINDFFNWQLDLLWEPIWEWFPKLEADVTTALAALPAKLLFSLFTGFFFEDVD